MPRTGDRDLLRRVRALSAQAADIVERTKVALRAHADPAALGHRPDQDPSRPPLVANPAPPGMFIGPPVPPPREARRMD